MALCSAPSWQATPFAGRALHELEQGIYQPRPAGRLFAQGQRVDAPSHARERIGVLSSHSSSAVMRERYRRSYPRRRTISGAGAKANSPAGRSRGKIVTTSPYLAGKQIGMTAFRLLS